MRKVLGICWIFLIILSACGGTAQDDPIKGNCEDTDCQTAPTPQPTPPPITTPTPPTTPEPVVPGLEALSKATGATPEFILETAASYGYTDFTTLPVNANLVEFLVEVSEGSYGDNYTNLLKQNYQYIKYLKEGDKTGGYDDLKTKNQSLMKAVILAKVKLIPFIELTTGKEVIDIYNEEKPKDLAIQFFVPSEWEKEFFPHPADTDNWGTNLTNGISWALLTYFGLPISVRIDGTCYSLFQFNADPNPNDELRGHFTLIECKDNAFMNYYYPDADE